MPFASAGDIPTELAQAVCAEIAINLGILQMTVTRKISCRLKGDGLYGQVKGRCSRRDATSFEMTRQDLGRSGVLKVRLGRDKIPCIA